jgi:hypothetical protein
VFNLWKSRRATADPGADGLPLQTARSSLPRGFTAVEAARAAILNGNAPEGLWTGRLKFEREPDLSTLPKGLTASHIDISECPTLEGLPQNLWAGTVTIRNCPAFSHIPASVAFERLELRDHAADLVIGEGASLGSVFLINCSGDLQYGEQFGCRDLVWRASPLQAFPPGIRISGTLDLTGSVRLTRLPDQMSLDVLILRGCPRLEYLPNRLEARSVDVSGCIGLQWQEGAFVEVGDLVLADCPQVASLPWWLMVKGSLDVANTGLSGRPECQPEARLLWRGVEVDARIAFHPDQIQVQEIFAQRNAEVRRVMLVRVGWERFFREAKPKIRHRDRDPGGERRLFHVSFRDREDLLVLNVNCPSTGRSYFVRVPAHVATCHQAAAWIAGFDDAERYEPVVET